MSNAITNASLHNAIVSYIIEHGYAPEPEELAVQFGASQSETEQGLDALAANHGVVLHPNSHRIWVMHPFGLAPTNFVVRSGDRSWWGNCAWCSLGVAALLDRDVTITTVLGAEGPPAEIHIRDGHVAEQDYVVHFPVPMTQAWDNVIYTCSTMLLFGGEAQVDDWCRRHRIPRGDVQSIEKIWQFSRVWYGRHLDPDWRKWTTDEARAIFRRFGLTHPIWDMPLSGDRF